MVKKFAMIPTLLGIGMLLFFSGWPTDLPALEKKLIKGGEAFPDVVLKTPAQDKDRTYLGVSGGAHFKIQDLKAKVILVEIMNVYCAACQNQAPLYNQLFDLIQSDPTAREQIKMIGIAVANNQEEVDTFRDHFQVRYPIITDPDYIIHGAVGGGPTPFSIMVRIDPKGKSALVADAHLGVNEKIQGLFQQMMSLRKMDLAAIRKREEKTKAQVITLKPPISEEAIQAKVKEAFAEGGGRLSGFETVSLKKGKVVYTGVIEKNGGTRRLFAQVISELPTCDVCHDTHFIYTFEAGGKILQFIPIQLTKYGNEDWDEADIARIRQKIVGRYIYNPFPFTAKVDAVTSATITSAAIYKGLNEGQLIFRELKAGGLI
jgi:uncharacterized protein with FMN-binding domain